MESFFALVDRLNGCEPAARAEVEAQVWSSFGVCKAVMVLDMSQFSLTVRRDGILPYLALIRRMQVVTGPIVRGHGGQVIKYEADDLLAVFDEAADAVSAGLAIDRALASADPRIVASIGIDYGRFLMIPGQDCFGDAVNVAYKLGEDLARPREILISAEAKARLGEAFPHPFQAHQASVSGLELRLYSLRCA